MLHELVEAADEIEGVVSLRELHAYVCLLPCLLVEQEDGEEAAGVDAALYSVVVVV